MKIQSPWHGKLDVLVRLACGCQTTWHEGETLHKGVYAWCEEHGDTTVADVLEPVSKYVAETAEGLRYEMAAEPNKVGPTLIYTVMVYDESGSDLSRMNQGRYCCGRVDLFLHPDHVCLVEDNDALDQSQVLAPQDTVLNGADPEDVFHFILDCISGKEEPQG